MHGRQQQRMPVGTRIVAQFQRDRLVDYRANAVADIAAQAEEVQAVLLINQCGKTHARLRDVGQFAIERAGRAGLDAGNVLAHLARDVARGEVWRAGCYRIAEIGEFERAVGTIAHAQAAAHTGGEKIVLNQRAGRPDRLCRQS